MVKVCYVIHGWDFNPKMNWYPWIKRELEGKGFKVVILEMPDTSVPVIKLWVDKLKDSVKSEGEIYFIGHSIGCQTIMRYLETLDVEVRGALFVAGWFNLANLEDEEVEQIAKPWIKESINLSKVRERIDNLKVILSDNDPYNYVKENADKFRRELGAEVRIEHNKEHFIGKKYPEILPEFLKL